MFAVHAQGIPGGSDLTLVGIAIGAYGLTQSMPQIAFGAASDRFGRKRSDHHRLVIFAIGSLVAAMAPDIYLGDRRPRPAGRRRDFGCGHGTGGRSHARAASHQGDGDDRVLDRARLRVVAGAGAGAPTRRSAWAVCSA